MRYLDTQRQADSWDAFNCTVKKSHTHLTYTAVPLQRGPFFPNPHENNPIARPWGRGMGCHLWVKPQVRFCPSRCSSRCSAVNNIMLYWTTLWRHPTVSLASPNNQLQQGIYLQWLYYSHTAIPLDAFVHALSSPSKKSYASAQISK